MRGHPVFDCLAWRRLPAKMPQRYKMTYRGTVKNGVVIFDNGVSLEDGTEVRIEPIHIKPTDSSNRSSKLFEAGNRAKSTGLTDLARNHDHYLYGHPKADQ